VMSLKRIGRDSQDHMLNFVESLNQPAFIPSPKPGDFQEPSNFAWIESSILATSSGLSPVANNS
jgi:hypothetical protein